MKTQKTPKKENKQAAAPKKEGGNSFLIKAVKNVALLLGAVILIKSFKGSKDDESQWNDGYQWFFTSLIDDNVKVMKQYKTLTYDQKMESKVGFNYAYFRFINQNTPENAVILMPPDSVFFPPGEKSEFQGFILTPSWAGYFVYPRKLVFEKQNNLALMKKVTHVAVMNSWGYDKLSYQAARNSKYNVLPIKN